MKFSPVRDTLGTALAVAPILAVGNPLGLIGVAAKKAFIKDNDSFAKKALIGIAAMIASGGAGLIPYLVTAPGQEAQKDVQACRTAVATQRYNQKA